MKLLLLLSVLAVGCGKSPARPNPENCRDGEYSCWRRLSPIGEQRDYCVNEKLDAMSDSDSVGAWGGDLVRALYEVCEKMYPEKKP